MVPKTVKMADIISALEREELPVILAVDPSIPLQEVVDLHNSTSDKSEIKMLQLVDSGKLRYLFRRKDFINPPEEAEYIKDKGIYFIHLTWKLV